MCNTPSVPENCPAGFVYCPSPIVECIKEDGLCDGNVDCQDGSDEMCGKMDYKLL